MYLIFDTETTGLPQNFSAPITDLENWPRLVQLAWQHHDHTGKLLSSGNHIVYPEGFTIPFNSEKIHGISTKRAQEEGEDLEFVLHEFRKAIDKAHFLIGHNVSFDEKIMGAEYIRKKIPSAIMDKAKIDTKDDGTDFCKIEGARGYKWPTLTELHWKLFDKGFEDDEILKDADEVKNRLYSIVARTLANPQRGISIANKIRGNARTELDEKLSDDTIKASYARENLMAIDDIEAATDAVFLAEQNK